MGWPSIEDDTGCLVYELKYVISWQEIYNEVADSNYHVTEVIPSFMLSINLRCDKRKKFDRGFNLFRYTSSSADKNFNSLVYLNSLL